MAKMIKKVNNWFERADEFILYLGEKIL